MAQQSAQTRAMDCLQKVRMTASDRMECWVGPEHEKNSIHLSQTETGKAKNTKDTQQIAVPGLGACPEVGTAKRVSDYIKKNDETIRKRFIGALCGDGKSSKESSA